MNFLSVPIIPTGLSGDPTHPSLGGVIGVIIVLLLYIGLIIYHKKNKSKK
jgi:hypothetical protein